MCIKIEASGNDESAIIANMSPSLVFVTGAWHSPAYWEKVTALLNNKCVCPSLPSTTGPGSFKDDIDVVRGAIESEITAGNDVVVVVHSYGSLPGASALKSLTTGSPRVLGFIAIATGFPVTGVAFLEGGIEPPPILKIENELAVLTVDPRELFYNDLSEEEGAVWVGRLRQQSTRAFYGGEHAYAGWKDVPTWYLITTNDNTFPTEVQRRFGTQAQAEGNVTVREIASSHSPMLSRPREVADFIKEAVSSFSS